MPNPAVWYARQGAHYVILEYDRTKRKRKYKLRYPTTPRKHYYAVDDMIFTKTITKKWAITVFPELNETWGNSGETVFWRLLDAFSMQEEEEFKTCWQIIKIDETGVTLRGAIYVDDTCVVHLKRKWHMNWMEFNKNWLIWYGLNFRWAKTSAWLSAQAIVIGLSTVTRTADAMKKWLSRKALLILGRKTAKRGLRHVFFNLVRGGILFTECSAAFVKTFVDKTKPFAEQKARLYHKGERMTIDDYTNKKLIEGAILAGAIDFTSTLISKGLNSVALKLIPPDLLKSARSRIIKWIREANIKIFDVITRGISNAAQGAVSDPKKPFTFDAVEYHDKLWQEIKGSFKANIEEVITNQALNWVESL